MWIKHPKSQHNYFNDQYFVRQTYNNILLVIHLVQGVLVYAGG